MAKFFGKVQGHRGAASRLGHKELETTTASYDGAVVTTMWVHEGETHVTVRAYDWDGSRGLLRTVLFKGPLAELLARGGK